MKRRKIMTDKDILTLINSLSSLEDSKKVEVAILLLSTIMNPSHAEQTAGFMVGLNEESE
jgi:hypothetical protein